MKGVVTELISHYYSTESVCNTIHLFCFVIIILYKYILSIKHFPNLYCLLQIAANENKAHENWVCHMMFHRCVFIAANENGVSMHI